MSKKTVWHKGPPPSIGWWPASAVQDDTKFRWWDGEQWSDWADASMPVRQAARQAYTPNRIWATEEIEWTDRPASWPARSRT